ncbi:MAG: glycosyltransferase [Myxococcota bacterium]
MNANGVDVLTSWPLPDGKMLDSMIENYQPDVIFEINRHKDQIPETRNSFFHVCLIHEHRSHDTVYTNTSGNSDFYYSIITPSGYGFPEHLDSKAKVFMAGFNEEVLARAQVQPKKYDLGFAGHMGNPAAFRRAFVGQLIDANNPQLGTIKELLKHVGISKTLINENDSVVRIRRKTEDYFRHKGFQDFRFDDYADNPLFLMLEYGFVRNSNRKYLCDLMVKTTDNLAFWGPTMWTLWPKYAPFYKKELKSSLTLLEAYSSLKINVHSTGTNLHPRIVDTMAMGTPMAIIRHESDDGPFGLDQFLEPDVHYISIDFDNFQEKVGYYLRHDAERQNIANQAMQTVRDSFSWKDRCKLVLDDLEAIF